VGPSPQVNPYATGTRRKPTGIVMIPCLHAYYLSRLAPEARACHQDSSPLYPSCSGSGQVSGWL